MTTKTQGWREAEALANEGCAATLDTAHEALADATADVGVPRPRPTPAKP